MHKLIVHEKIKTGLGLASNTYKQVLTSGEISLLELIEWAAKKGFSWIEVRDSDISMERAFLKKIKTLADTLDIRIHYSWDNEDVLRPDLSFYKGIENAAVFGKGTCCRVLIAPNTVTGKRGYTRDEMELICTQIKRYNRVANEKEIKLCYENSMEPLSGDEKNFYGMTEILSECKGMYTTLDAANFTNHTTLINPTEEELIHYYRYFSDRIIYFHLKMTKDHHLLDAIEEKGDFDVFHLFEEFSNNENILICLEIPQQLSLIKMTQAVEKSLEILRRGRK